jgi:CBS domain-containing protein
MVRAVCREFLQENVAVSTTILAISTAAAGIVLLLIIMLIAADQERSIELRARQYGIVSQGVNGAKSEQAASTTSRLTSEDAQVDALRWVRAAAFGITTFGLLSIATCAMYRSWSTRRTRVENWPRPYCAHPNRHHADGWQTVRAALGASQAELLGNRLTVRQVMSTITPLAMPKTSARALKRMLANKPMMLVAICDPLGRLLGVVGNSDLQRRPGACAAELMMRDPYTAPPGARLDAAVSLMLDNQLYCLPIVENGQLRGMLTAADLMVALDCLLQAIRDLSTGGASLSTDTQTIYNQDTKRFADTSAQSDEPPDTITRPLIG